MAFLALVVRCLLLLHVGLALVPHANKETDPAAFFDVDPAALFDGYQPTPRRKARIGIRNAFPVEVKIEQGKRSLT